MADVQAARRYAQAAFDIAREQGTVSQWRSDVDDVATVLAESGLAPLLADDRLPLDRRLGLLDRTLDVSPLAMNFARLLVSKGRSSDARAVATAFNRIADAAEGIEQATITTAVPLEPAKVADIEQQLGQRLGKTIQATADVDPSIIGGLVIRVGDRLIDGSVRTKLRNLRRELEGAR
jgi:F-type H+-transporting ATPase subunit delta